MSGPSLSALSQKQSLLINGALSHAEEILYYLKPGLAALFRMELAACERALLNGRSDQAPLVIALRNAAAVNIRQGHVGMYEVDRLSGNNPVKYCPCPVPSICRINAAPADVRDLSCPALAFSWYCGHPSRQKAKPRRISKLLALIE